MKRPLLLVVPDVNTGKGRVELTHFHIEKRPSLMISCSEWVPTHVSCLLFYFFMESVEYLSKYLVNPF